MFGKKSLRPTSIQTLIGESAHIEGNITFDGSCHELSIVIPGPFLTG